MPQGFCSPPICWNLTYNFANANILVITPAAAAVPNWGAGIKMPLNSFPQLEAAFTKRMNAGAILSCDDDCVCVRLHKRAINVLFGPQFVAPHPNGKTVIYMENIRARGTWGMCLQKKGGVRIKKGDKWVYPEDLPDSDILPKPPSSGGSSGGHKKKKKSGKGRKRR